MATKEEKKKAIRQLIIDAAKVYSHSLAGKTFLYVYGEEYFEVTFPIENFLHLTGVTSRLNAKGVNGAIKNVIAVYQIDKGTSIPRMITNYVEKKK